MGENTIVINKKVATFYRKCETTGDVIVPDIKPDILSIISSSGNAYIYKEDISKGKVRLDGNIDTYTAYLSDSGETRSMQSTLSFSESFEDIKIEEDSIIKSSVRIDSIEAKMLNERKISIKAVLKVNLEVYSKEELEINSDLVKNTENADLQVMKEDVNIKSLVGMNSVKTSIKEDISVDTSYEVAEILKTSVRLENIENKISYNKVLAKADANIKVLFLAEDGRIAVAEANIPVMSFIDLEGVKEDQECNVEYTIRNMLFKVSSTDSHSITCQIEFEVCLYVYENKIFSIIEDIYGTTNTVTFNTKTICIPSNNGISEEKISISEKVIVEDILNIYDVESRVNVLNNTESELVLNIYYEADNRSGLNVKEIRIPFIIKANVEDQNQLEFRMANEKFTVNGEHVSLDIDIFYSLPNENYKEIRFAEDFEINDLNQEEDYKMYMYFVKEGDTIWKIAKRFRVTMDEIIELNDLENPDKINVGDRLFIMR